MLNVNEVAAAAGLKPDSIRHHHKTAIIARREGTADERTLPAPRGLHEGANVWDEAEIQEWIDARKTPAKRGAIPKADMRAVLAAAEAGQIDRVIAIATKSLS